ncbi:MAG: hypothetical protein L6Q40_04415 [Azonexus sp.]|nr:hypothetical protein [Azonexus sp.]
MTPAWQGFADRAHLENHIDRQAALPMRWLLTEGAGRQTHVRVYIEGDGRPWIGGGNVVAPDPTPRTPHLLSLMALDPGPAIYLGRPCYFGLVDAPVCEPALWTDARFSEQVVDAMASSLRHWLDAHPAVKHVTLVGHSGGGVIALLIAERLPPVVRVVAMASPVNVHRWVALHGYRPLHGSLDPSQTGLHRAGVNRLLLLGEQDANVPPDLFGPQAAALGIDVKVIAGEGHLCCHAANWGEFIGSLDRP